MILKLLTAIFFFLIFLVILYLPKLANKVGHLKENGMKHSDAIDVGHNQLGLYQWFVGIVSAIISLTITYLIYNK